MNHMQKPLLPGLGSAFLGACLALSPFVRADAASIISIAGKAIVKDGERERVIASPNLPFSLPPGASIEAVGAGARVLLDDGSELTVAARSAARIPGGDARDGARFEVLHGKIRAFVRRRGSDDGEWRAKANNAVVVVGAGDAEFLIDTSRERTLLCTFNGIVEVRAQEAPGESVEVPANDGVVIADEGRISPPVALDAEQLSAWRRETLIDHSSLPENKTRIRALGINWIQEGPTPVEYLDPGALYSQFQMLSAHPMIWSRFDRNDNSPLGAAPSDAASNFTARFALDGNLTPTRNYLLHAVAAVGIKGGSANPEQSGFQLHELFALFRHDSSHSLAIGRQEWELGEGLMVGSDPWSPFTISYDGALATLRWAGARVRLFGALLPDRGDEYAAKDWFAGAQVDLSGAPVSLYGFWVKREGVSDPFSTINEQSRHALIGARSDGIIHGPFFESVEVAYERGTIGSGNLQTKDLSAWLAKADLGISWRLGAIDGSIKAVFLQASGSSNSDDGTVTSFVPLEPDSHRFLGLVNAFPQLSDIRRLGGSVVGRQRFGAHYLNSQIDYSNFTRVSGGGGSVLGNEVDVQLGYEPITGFNVNGGLGWLVPGSAFSADQPSAYLVFVSAQYQF